jgi:hypothetical protein
MRDFDQGMFTTSFRAIVSRKFSDFIHQETLGFYELHPLQFTDKLVSYNLPVMTLEIGQKI